MRPNRPRVEPLPPEAWTDEQRELLAPMVEGKGLGLGVLNIFSTLVRHPKLFKRWSVLANHVMFKSTLGAREREILILRTARRCGSHYEWSQHVAIGKAAGLTDAEIERLDHDGVAPGWPERDAVLVRAADELNDDHCLGDETWAALARHFDEDQVLDAIFAVGNYAMLAMALNSLGVQLED